MTLPSVETLGSTDVICTDKTGTLTEGQMTATSLWQDEATVAIADGAAPAKGAVAELLDTAVRCNNATLSRSDDGAWSAQRRSERECAAAGRRAARRRRAGDQDARDHQRRRLFCSPAIAR